MTRKHLEKIWAKIYAFIFFVGRTIKHWLAFGMIVITAIGFLFAWREDIQNTRSSQYEHQAEVQQNLQQRLNYAASKARITVENQILLCSESHRTQAELKVERNNALVPLVALTSGSRNIFDDTVQDRLNEFIKTIDSINDVCAMILPNFDADTRAIYHNITNEMDSMIRGSFNKVYSLRGQTHRPDVSFELASR